MSFISSITEYNNLLNIGSTNNEKVYKILDLNESTGLNVLWSMMVKEAIEMNSTGVTVEEDSGSNYSWSSC